MIVQNEQEKGRERENFVFSPSPPLLFEPVRVGGTSQEPAIADNNAKFDITESESLLFGRNFGVGTDIQTGPNGNLYVVSLDRGVIYEVFKKTALSRCP